MIDEILQIAEDVQARRDRIDNAANVIVTATAKFRQFEQAIINLDAAVASLKVAVLLIQNSQADKIIGALNGVRQVELVEAIHAGYQEEAEHLAAEAERARDEEEK